MTPLMLIGFCCGLALTAPTAHVDSQPTLIDAALAEQPPIAETYDHRVMRCLREEYLRKLGAGFGSSD